MSKKKNLLSIIWFAVENLSTIAFGLVSVFLIARHFGPENLGKLSVVQSASALLMFLATLGLDHFIVRDLTRNPYDGKYIGTVMGMQMAGWLLYSLGVLVLLFTLGKLATLEMWLIASFVIMTTLFTRCTLGRLYFQAINLPKAIAASALVSRIAAILYVVISIYLGLSYLWCLLYLPLQAAIQCLMLWLRYKAHLAGERLGWACDLTRAIRLLKESLPALVAAAIFPIFMQSDVLIISHLLSDHAAGIYSAASRLVVQFNFVGPIIVMSFYVALSRKLEHRPDFEMMITGLVTIFLLISLPLALITSLCAPWIVHLLYGAKFEGTDQVLAALAWVWLFVIPASLYSRLLILRGQVRYELIKSLLVAFMSVSLNLVLIPRYGVVAAAWVSVFSYAVADFLIYAFFRDTRDVFKIAISSMVNVLLRPRLAFDSVVYVLNSK
ncbi:flippase [Chitinibacter tainanensis]|uniref:flippase n=1 Tax=Chitinibacter tainanensis TaxID=230667 RepID=UPI00041C90AB|nr:flippase [Chitinibacter tainanensis]